MRKKRVHIRDGFSLKSSTAVYGHTQYSPALPLPHPIVHITKETLVRLCANAEVFLPKLWTEVRESVGSDIQRVFTFSDYVAHAMYSCL
jgi:hypothetical protein